MEALLLALFCGGALILAYATYGRWLANRVFTLREDAPTPAFSLRDGKDYCPTARSVVFGHHFTSIAGTGPIVGPAIAVMWGWAPAIAWVLLGAIFIGAVHDLGSIVVSLRNKGRTIGDIAGDLLGPRVRLIFLFVLVMGLWIVLAVFGLVIASVLRAYPAAIFPVLFQIPLAVGIGLFIHRRGGSIGLVSVVALVLMYLSVVFGDAHFGPTLTPLHDFNALLAAQPLWAWTVALLLYAYIASVLPVWVLLQPRDYINALQLITTLGLLFAGLVGAATLGGVAMDGAGAVVDAAGAIADAPARMPLEIVAPVVNWQPEGAPPLIPILFITIACGAVSGFHCLVGSGTTSKQIERETDARAIGFGSMLTEAWLAVLVILACAAGLGLGVRHTLETRTSSLSVAADGQTRLTEELESVIPLRDGRSYRVRLHATSEPITDDDAMRDPGALRTRSASIERATADDTDAPGAFLALDEASLRDAPMRIALPEGALLLRGERGAESFLSGQLAFDARYRSWSAAGGLRSMVSAFVDGAANLLAAIGIPVSLGVALMGVMVASFAGTTMDTACRLQRYVIQELSRTFLPRPPQQACIACGYDLSGLHVGMTCPECGSGAPPVGGAASLAAQRRAASVLNPFKWLSTAWGAALFAIVSAAMLAAMPAQGQAWSLANAGQGGLILWPLFGATNQLLAGLAFIVLYAWLRATGRARWFTVGPTLFMLLVPASAMAWQGFIGNAENPSWLTQRNWTLVGVASATLALEAWLIVEALIRMARPLHAPPDDERTTNDAAP